MDYHQIKTVLGLFPLLLAHDFDRTRRVADDSVRDAPQKQPLETRVAVRADDDKVGVPFLRLVNDTRARVAVKHRRFSREAARP